MSVKFQQETVRTSGGKSEDVVHDLAHKVGERLTGGKTQSGYLAVNLTIWDVGMSKGDESLLTEFAVLPQTATIESAAHQDADVGGPVGFARTAGVMDRS